MCPAASTGGCSGRVGPGSSGTGPFPSASGTLQRAGPYPRSLPGLVGRPAAVALDVEFEDVGAVDEAVDGGDGHGVAAEDLAPGAERLVGDHQERAVLIARADQLEEDAGLRLLAGDVGEVVEDDEVVLVELADGGFEGEVPAGRLELLHQVGRALVFSASSPLDPGTLANLLSREIGGTILPRGTEWVSSLGWMES